MSVFKTTSLETLILLLTSFVFSTTLISKVCSAMSEEHWSYK